MAIEWHPYDREDKPNTAPPHEMREELVWIFETNYFEGVTLGYFDGHTFCLWNGDDDIHVSHWATIDYPAKPDGA